MQNIVIDNIKYNTIVVQTDETAVNISQPVTNVIETITAGPQGPAGSGPVNTGSFATTGSNQFNGNQVITGSLTNGAGSQATGIGAHAEGQNTVALGDYSHAEGNGTRAETAHSHAEGTNTICRNDGGTYSQGFSSHAEGLATTASGNFSRAEGNETYASGFAAHAEGYRSVASGNNSHAEGYYTVAAGDNSRAIGNSTTANGNGSHAEGYATITSGNYSHAEGYATIAYGNYSHAEGIGTIASGSGQNVVGQFNKQNNTSSLFIIGNGTSNSNRSDLILFNSNSVELSGSLSISGSFFINNQALPNFNSFVTTSSFNAYTSSINTYTGSLNAKTSSFVTTSSFNTYTSSVESSLNAKANLAGGNSFTGDQNVAGTISSDTLFVSKLDTVTVLASDTTVLLEYDGNVYLGGSLDIHIEKDSSNFTLYNVIVSNDTMITNSALLVINSTSFGTDVINNITIVADINGSRVRVKAINTDSSNYSARIFPRLIKNQI